MAAKTIAELDLQSRRVFVRADLDVPLTPAGGVSDATRIHDSLPTIKHAIAQGGRVILASHLGRPRGKRHPELSLVPVAASLAELLDQDVLLTDEPVGDGAKKVVSDLRDGSVAMLENLRFSAGEEANDEGFARALASYADVYVNDSFGSAHRPFASTVGMVKHVGAAGMGFLMDRELKALGQLLGEVGQPFVGIVGGADVADKLILLESLLGRAQCIVIGGATANTFLAARGGHLGTSLVEGDRLPLVRAFLSRAARAETEVLLPQDLVVAEGRDSSSGRVVPAMQVPDGLAALDIGPRTVEEFSAAIARGRTVFWNGPMGVFESAPFAAGTMAIARAVAGIRLGITVVGGDDSAAAMRRSGVASRITHIATGGNASLEFIAGKRLPGLAALEAQKGN